MTPECFQGWACSHADFSCTLVVYFQSSFPEKIIAVPFLQGHACPRWTRPLLAHQHSLSGWINCCAKWRKLCHASPHQRLPHPSPPSVYFFPEQYDAGLGTEMFNGAQNEGGSTNGKRLCVSVRVCVQSRVSGMALWGGGTWWKQLSGCCHCLQERAAGVAFLLVLLLSSFP